MIRSFILILLIPFSSHAIEVYVPKVDPCADTYWAKPNVLVDEDGDFCLAELALRTTRQVLRLVAKGQTLDTSAESFEMKGREKQMQEVFNPEKTVKKPTSKKSVKELNDELYIEGSETPIDAEKVVEMFGQVMLEENANGIKTRFGTFHDWGSKIMKSRSRYATFGSLNSSKMLVCLTMGACLRFIPTGQEKALINWMNAQADSSITFENLFRQSFILNEGNVYFSILTISNALSYHWRDPDRANIPWVKKLTPITNRWQDRGDTFGSWYHFFGMALYGYIAGEVPAKIVASVESWMSAVGSEGENEEQEDMINMAGGIVGARLAKLTIAWDFLGWQSKPERKQKEFYLNLNEDFRDRIYYEPNPDYVISPIEIFDHASDGSQLTTSQVNIKPRSPAISHNNCVVDLLPKLKGQKRFFSENIVQKMVPVLNPTSGTIIYFDTWGDVEDLRVFIRCR